MDREAASTSWIGLLARNSILLLMKLGKTVAILYSFLLRNPKTMELIGDYPIRAFIRHKAKMQIIGNSLTQNFCPDFDEELLKDLSKTLLQSNKVKELYRPYRSRDEANMAEDEIATELAAVYKHVKQQQDDPLVQSLNALL
jgi:hypothetical protein